MLDEYEQELVKEILAELKKIKEDSYPVERIEKLAHTLLKTKTTTEDLDVIPVSHYV